MDTLIDLAYALNWDYYDTKEAMEYAVETREVWNAAVETREIRKIGFEDVKGVVVAVEGEADGPEWIAVLQLTDNGYMTLKAGCDYTGWDCQAGGSAYFADTPEDIVRMGLDDEDRCRLLLMILGS